MQKYQDTIINNGLPIGNASITITNYPSGTTPTIYVDNGITVNGSNIVTSDSNGRFFFYATDGRYSLSISKTGITTVTVTDILLEDPALGNAVSLTNATLTNAAAPVTPAAGYTVVYSKTDKTLNYKDDIGTEHTIENIVSKDATGGYTGLTLFKINFKNAANTFTSFFANANTAARTYTFQDRDGTIADNTDLALKATLDSPTFTGTPSLPTSTIAVTQTAGDSSTKLSTTAFTTTAIAAIPTPPSPIQPVTTTVGSNALTVGLNTTPLQFRSTTLTTGVPVSRTVSSPLSLVVPSGATLGTINAVQSQLILLAIDNAGTVELAIVNISGGNDLSETGLISTTAISAAASAANVIYSTTARTSIAYRVIGLVTSTQATAGTWATAPSLVQGMGGQALAAMQSLGYGQTWQDVKASRAAGTTYYNTTAKPIEVNWANSITGSKTFSVNGVIVGASDGTAYISTVSAVVPVGGSYLAAAGAANFIWSELR